MHFLIDANIIVDFVKEGKDEHFIEQLFTLVSNETVALLMPDVLELEWKDKCEQTLLYVSKAFSTARDLARIESTSALLKDNLSLSRERLYLIHQLLAKGIRFKTPSYVKSDTVDRSLRTYLKNTLAA